MPVRPIEVSTFAKIPAYVPIGVLYYTQDTGSLYVGTGASKGPGVNIFGSGYVAGLVGDNATDNTAAVITALANVYAAGGGTLKFPPGNFLIAGQINLPNDGGSAFNNSPMQPSIRITGSGAAGALIPGGGSTPVPFGSGPADGGTVLNLTYTNTPATLTLTSVANASAGATTYAGTITGGAANALVNQIFMIAGFPTNTINNGAFVVTASTSTTLTVNNPGGISETHAATASNSPVAKINSFGVGMLEIDHLTLVDTGNDSSTFFFTSNTTCHIHDVTFLGNKVATVSVASNNDAIWLGNNNGAANGTFAAPFQGYGTTITHCYFQNIKKAVFGQAYANSVNITENTIWSSCGNPTGAAIELGTASYSSGADANNITGNLGEVLYYKYLVRIIAGSSNKIIGNDSWDPIGGTFVSQVRLEASAFPNLVIGGFSGGLPYLSDVPVTSSVPSLNTCLSQESVQPSVYGQPIAFSMIATASLTAGQVVKIDPSNPAAVVVCATTDTGGAIPIGIVANSPSAGGNAQIVSLGRILGSLPYAPVLGTGTATIGQFVIVDTTTNGRVKCTSSYTAGTVLGVVIGTQNTVGQPVAILMGLR